MLVTNYISNVVFPRCMAICEKLAPLSSVLVFLAPMPTLLHIWETKSTGNLPLLPYTAMLMNAFLWFMYGFMRDEPKIWTANAVGFFVGCFYFLEFVRYAPKRSRLLPGSVTQHFHACFLVVLGTLTLALLDQSEIIGHVAVLFCIVMFASPLAALPTVLETKSAKAIPLAYTAAVLTNSILWTIVGILDMHDINIYFPTVLGLGLSGLQLYLKLKFGNGHDLNDMYTTLGGGTGFDDTALLFSPVL